MTSKKIIERLQKGDWCIFVSTYHEVALVLNACIDSNIKWFNDIKASDLPIEFYLDEFIGCSYGMNILTHDSEYVFSDNITDWFFSEINKGDGIGREHLHNILDAWLDGEIIQVKNIRTENWVKETDDCSLLITLENYYRIKPKQAPLPIPEELWKYIKPEFKYAAMDRNGFVYLYDISPTIAYNDRWVTEGEEAESLQGFNINTDGIDWRLSLTKRPEGL